jgi:DNA segregation ATPase FtsK/SpoIIIE-like protein
MDEKRERIPTLEYLAEDYAEKVKVITIGSLQAYLRCGYVRASNIISRMQAAGLVKQINDYKFEWVEDIE